MKKSGIVYNEAWNVSGMQSETMKQSGIVYNEAWNVSGMQSETMKQSGIVYPNYEYFDNNNNNKNQIPKIIIQTWKTKAIPEKYKEDYDSIRKWNPNYEYLFFNDDDISYFLEKNYPNYFIIYKKLPVIIQKIDFFRYVAIYHYGGFYFDLDMRCLKSLDPLLQYSSVFPKDMLIKNKCEVKEKIKRRYQYFCKKNMDFMVGQYAFAAIPKHPFIERLIKTIELNIDRYLDDFKVYGDTLQYVYSTTGPDFITNIYIDYKEKDKIHILDYDKSQYFGEYAVHNHYGTWK